MTEENINGKKLTMKDLETRIADLETKIVLITDDGDLVKRISAVEENVTKLEGQLTEIPNAVALEVNASVLPQIEDAIRNSAGKILLVGTKQNLAA